MSASHTNDTKPFDPTLQTFTLMTSDGSNRTLTIDDLNSWYLYNIKLTISMGCQFGALFVMFLVTLIMTSPLKRRTPVFILNMLSLGLGASFSLFYMISETTRYFRFYEWFTYDISFVTPGDEAISVLGTLMSAFMLVTINMSLVLNAHTVCKTMDRKYYYYGIIAVSIILLVLSGCFRIAQCILNILSIMGESDWIFQRNNYWLQKTALMSESGSIWWFCIIFSAKLIHSQYQRRKMRMCGWPYIQVLTSMAGATMIIPSIFAILQWTSGTSFPEAGTLCLTIVALLLPLSSLWAAKITRDGESAFTSERLWGGNGGGLGPQTGSASSKTWNSEATRGTDLRFELRQRTFSMAPLNPVIECNTTNIGFRRDSTDVDLERMGVRVAKSYSVHSERD